MRYRLLGELVVEGANGVLRIASARQRTVLSLLLLEANRMVPVDRLVEAVWDDAPPSSARSQVQICISALRRTLAAANVQDAIRTNRPGYLIEVPDGQLDLQVFEQLAARGRGAEAEGRLAEAARCYRQALALWRGVPFTGVESRALGAVAIALSERRLALIEQSIDVRLRLGENHELIGELVALTAEHPLRERLFAQLMTALSRDGRRAEALQVYRRAREKFVEELGLEPGPALRQLEQAILSGAPELHPTELVAVELTAPADEAATPLPPEAPVPPAPRSAAAPVQEPAVVDEGTLVASAAALPQVSQTPVTGPTASGTESPAPGTGALTLATTPLASGTARHTRESAAREPAAIMMPRSAIPAVPLLLPADIADFTGRESVVEQLSRRLIPDPAAPVPVVVISGQGGVGKTTLAVHVAHQVADRFPDGQLYATLGGASRHPLDPAKALERFLRALGVPDAAIPETLEERAELYRARLAERRVLVVLDDAAAEDQVRPLLPGSGTGALLVTARRRLTSLPGAHRVDLGVLDVASGLALVRGIVGAARVDKEPDAARDLVRCCGGLPLALRIAAARAAAKPHWPLSRLVSRLADGGRRLDELTYGGLGIRSNIAVTYEGLGMDARRLFRRLALTSNTGFDAWVAVPLLESTAARTEDVLEELVDVRLVEVERGAVDVPRYHLHDLVRAYAAERLAAEESPEATAAALRRLLRALLYLVEEARRRGCPDGPAPLSGPTPRYPLPPPLVDMVLADPLEWYERERQALAEAVGQAAGGKMDDLCWELATGAAALFEARNHREGWRTTHETALEVVGRTGNRRGEAALRCSLGSLAWLERRVDDAAAEWTKAAALLAELGDTDGHDLIRARLDMAS